MTVKWLFSDLSEIALATKGSELPQTISGKAGVCTSCQPLIRPRWLLSLGRLSSGSERHLLTCVLSYRTFFGGFDLVKWKLRTVTTLTGWGFNFVTRWDFCSWGIFSDDEPSSLASQMTMTVLGFLKESRPLSPSAPHTLIPEKWNASLTLSSCWPLRKSPA